MRQETKRLLVEAIVDRIEKRTLCERISHLLDDFAIDQLASGIITKITVDKDGLLQTLRKINNSKGIVLVDIELGEPQIRDNDIYIPYKRTFSKVDSDGNKEEDVDKWWQSHTVPYATIDSGNTPSWLTLDSI